MMLEDKNINLQDAVTIVSWTHNINVHTLAFTLLQLVTRKCCVPGVLTGNSAMEFLCDDEGVRKIIE